MTETNADFQMDWDNIRIFLSVARAGQFSAAASQLRIDNGTVGRRINALEKSLGVRLFDRQTTGCVLTDAGDRLYKAAEEVESQLLRAKGDLSQSDLELSGTVRICRSRRVHHTFPVLAAWSSQREASSPYGSTSTDVANLFLIKARGGPGHHN
jgi:DNA-binding transcriptional LysR family regulator